MNDIQIKQNTPEILDFLFSARFYMNHADLLTTSKYCCIIISVILSLINLPLKKDYIDNIILILSFISLPLNSAIKKSIKKGALTKQYIDYNLYDFKKDPFENYELIIESKNYAIAKNPKFYKIQIENNGDSKERGVKDWYFVNRSNPKLKAILICQKQNIYWDQKLIKIYKWLIYICLATLFIIFLLFIYTFQSNFLKILIPLSIYGYSFLELIIEINNQEKLMIEINVRINYIENTKVLLKNSELLKIQKLIDERRNFLIIPDQLHKMLSKMTHKNVKEIFS